jgi:hypothetical protein
MIPKDEWDRFFIGIFWALIFSIPLWVGIGFSVYKIFW